jgi:hypothetical protein
MDRVKFGRALGYGARHAAKTLAQAVDAASASNPASGTSGSPSRPIQSRAPAAPLHIPDVRHVRSAGREAKRSLAAPFVRFSSVVWLQVTGVFFALVAFTMGAAAWRARAGFHTAAASGAALKLYAYVAVCLLFSYFTISSFVRAGRK